MIYYRERNNLRCSHDLELLRRPACFQGEQYALGRCVNGPEPAEVRAGRSSKVRLPTAEPLRTTGVTSGPLHLFDDSSHSFRKEWGDVVRERNGRLSRDPYCRSDDDRYGKHGHSWQGTMQHGFDSLPHSAFTHEFECAHVMEEPAQPTRLDGSGRQPRRRYTVSRQPCSSLAGHSGAPVARIPK